MKTKTIILLIVITSFISLMFINFEKFKNEDKNYDSDIKQNTIEKDNLKQAKKTYLEIDSKQKNKLNTETIKKVNDRLKVARSYKKQNDQKFFEERISTYFDIEKAFIESKDPQERKIAITARIIRQGINVEKFLYKNLEYYFPSYIGVESYKAQRTLAYFNLRKVLKEKYKTRNSLVVFTDRGSLACPCVLNDQENIYWSTVSLGYLKNGLPEIEKYLVYYTADENFNITITNMIDIKSRP